MTPQAKKVRTAWVSVGVPMVAAGGADVVGADTWIPQDNITIIGALARASIVAAGAGWDSGRCIAKFELSRVAINEGDSTILNVGVGVDCWEATVGINATQTIIGDMHKSELLMLPEGYGIDIDEAEIVYLNYTWANDMANDHHASGAYIIYYVER